MLEWAAVVLVLAVIFQAVMFVALVSRVSKQDHAATRPSPAPEAGPVVRESGLLLAQEIHDSGAAARFDTYTRDFYSVAQTFSPVSADVVLSDVSLFVQSVLGERAYLDVYDLESRRDPVEGQRVASVPIDLFEADPMTWTTIALPPGLEMRPDHPYSFVVRVDDPASSITIGSAHARDVYEDGEAWYYLRQTTGTGEVLGNAHVWQYFHDDLAFRLRFVADASA